MEKLKPCPFCGNKNPSLDKQGWNVPTDDGGYLWVDMFRVVCVQCVASSFSYCTEDMAIEAWNRRTSDARNDEQ